MKEKCEEVVKYHRDAINRANRIVKADSYKTEDRHPINGTKVDVSVFKGNLRERIAGVIQRTGSIGISDAPELMLRNTYETGGVSLSKFLIRKQIEKTNIQPHASITHIISSFHSKFTSPILPRNHMSFFSRT
jgi:hypothetical protein